MLKNLSCIFVQSIAIFILFCSVSSHAYQPTSIPTVKLGIDNLLEDKFAHYLHGKRVGILTNSTGITGNLKSSIYFLKDNAVEHNYNLAAIFTPEHGLKGINRNLESVKNDLFEDNIPIYSLYGDTKRPTFNMLKDLDVIIYDIQDVGSRSFTYITTLFYTMEEAAKNNVKVIIADRPNPMGGLTVDGPMVEPEWRSFYSFVNVPYCYGMTIGELASFFNNEYKVNCDLTIIPMTGWKRDMIFSETGLQWIPPSSHIPEPDTAFYYSTTGILGELEIVSIGVGFTLPFKLIGAPWANGQHLSDSLNAKNLPGVKFHPYSFKPYYGKYKEEECNGVKILITDFKSYKPVTTQFAIIDMLKTLYPVEFNNHLNQAKEKYEIFSQVNGTNKVLEIIKGESTNSFDDFLKNRKQSFEKTRKKYLMVEYSIQ